ncbi:DUF2922 domain-containing protein [Metabacillus sp. 113a]|uniref:DUF2922 domain-containing protein n=1 Tax=Metabacillus sp. 113a TaxID=3404706 RepID=UPI003CEF2FDA
MAKTLELQFGNELGRTVTVSVDAPKETLTDEEITAAMDGLLTADIFTSSGGNLTAKKGARVVERNVVELEII